PGRAAAAREGSVRPSKEVRRVAAAGPTPQGGDRVGRVPGQARPAEGLDVGPAIERLDVSVYGVPTEGGPESDGTLTWDHTTVVVVEAAAGGVTGLGFTYGPPACGSPAGDPLRAAVSGLDAFDLPATGGAM